MPGSWNDVYIYKTGGAYLDFDVVHRVVLGKAQDEVLDTFGEAYH